MVSVYEDKVTQREAWFPYMKIRLHRGKLGFRVSRLGYTEGSFVSVYQDKVTQRKAWFLCMKIRLHRGKLGFRV